MFDFHDVSYAQGLYNMGTDPNPAVEMKMTGFYYGSKVGYTDVQAVRNYSNATRLGKVPILYHFAGGGDPIAEADYFIANGAMPFADGDIYELDYELNDSMNPPADPDAWCRAFADRIKERTGVYPLFYTYTDLIKQHGFTKTLEVCGLIQANYAVSPDADIPGPSYIIQQYTDTPLDTNRCFIPLATLKLYARNSQPASVPAPVAPTPSAPPAPITEPQVAPPATIAVPVIPVVPKPVVKPVPKPAVKSNFIVKIWRLLWSKLTHRK